MRGLVNLLDDIQAQGELVQTKPFLSIDVLHLLSSLLDLILSQKVLNLLFSHTSSYIYVLGHFPNTWITSAKNRSSFVLDRAS